MAMRNQNKHIRRIEQKTNRWGDHKTKKQIKANKENYRQKNQPTNHHKQAQ